RKALRDIRDCRSAALGGRVQQCDRCGHRVILHNSCRNRHCPKCQATARARWLAQREAELLPVPYFHVVFKLPSQIGRVARQNPTQIYNMLFRAAASTLLETAADPRLLGAAIGFLAVLHTWGQNLHLHPHLHCVVRRHLARRLALDRLPKILLLPARAPAQPSLPKILPAIPAASVSRRRASLAWQTQTSVGTRGLPSSLRSGHFYRLGRSRQTAFRRTPPRAAVSGPLYSPRRHLQPSPALASKRLREFRVERLCSPRPPP